MVSPLRAVRPTNPAVCPQWTTGPATVLAVKKVGQFLRDASYAMESYS